MIFTVVIVVVQLADHEGVNRVIPVAFMSVRWRSRQDTQMGQGDYEDQSNEPPNIHQLCA